MSTTSLIIAKIVIAINRDEAEEMAASLGLILHTTSAKVHLHNGIVAVRRIYNKIMALPMPVQNINSDLSLVQ